MIGMLFSLTILSGLSGQDEAKAPWRSDVREAREDALREGRPCVLLLYVDSK